ncbi:unnamed protein product [Mytilus edulis]|uniref:DZIP3-like HEPN domain-containing protein n=1 Tax=Mytilus edulis TaxID=6550 RepID=A0A8S3S533_MYTED|nr:unnamed protein product [Mytilus edulis]
MDKEDKRRYFIVGSVYLEVVTPLFQQKLEGSYKGLNFRCLEDFLDNKAVLHTLFHLRHRYARCCTDKENCTNPGALPLNHHQWKKLYVENPGPGIHNCFCKYTAKSVQAADLDVSLCGLLLYNCCSLGHLDEEAVNILRRNKNDYLSHNTTCGIIKDEYDSLMDELKSKILQLDQTKEDELIRIQNRPLDDSLCNKYMTTLLNIHEVLEKIDTNTTQILSIVHTNNIKLQSRDDELHIYTFQEFFQYLATQSFKDKTVKLGNNYSHPIKPYILGQSIFTLHQQTDLKSVVIGGDWRGGIAGIVMMDDGRLVMGLPYQNRLLICKTDESQVDIINVLGSPWCVTAVSNSTVAVTLWKRDCIEMFDINNKLKVNSISVPGMRCFGITSINNKLVVGGECRILIIDHQTGEVVQVIQTNFSPNRLHGSGDRIYYCDIDYYHNNNLYWYSYTDDAHHIISLPSTPRRMTTLQDGSLYLLCRDGSIQHLSSDGKQYKQVDTIAISPSDVNIHYNLTQRKLVIRQTAGLVKVFNEKFN